MKPNIKVVGSESEGWNVEVHLSEVKMVFACISRSEAHELAERIDDCSWYQIERI